MTGLHLAAQHDAVDIVELLLDKGSVEILEKEEQVCIKNSVLTVFETMINAD